MLASLIEEGHDDSDPSCLALYRRDHSLEVLEMVIRRHMIDETVHPVSHSPVHHINEDEYIFATGRFPEHCPALSAGETLKVNIHKVIILNVMVSVAQRRILFKGLFSERGYVLIDLFPHRGG